MLWLRGTFDGVRLSVKDDVGRTVWPAGPVVVNGGGPKFPELWEELADVRIGDAVIQVADDQFPGPGGLANDAAPAARTFVVKIMICSKLKLGP